MTDRERDNGHDPPSAEDELEELDPKLKLIENRLRNMEWPKPPPGMKERCLEDFMARIADMDEKDREDG